MLLVLLDNPNLATHIFIAHAYIFRIYFFNENVSWVICQAHSLISRIVMNIEVSNRILFGKVIF